MYRQVPFYTYVGLSKLSAIIFVCLSLFFLGSLFFSASHHLFLDGQVLSTDLSLNIVRLVLTGLVFAILAALLAWPFALATAVVMVQESARTGTQVAVRFFRVLAHLPSMLFGFVFCWSLGPILQLKFQGVWMSLFSQDSRFTEFLSFAVTLVSYPLTIFSSSSEILTVNMFYRSVKTGIVELAADGFSAFIIVLSLSFLLIPIFTVALYGVLSKNKNDQYIQAARALGATDWESLYLTMTHAMRTHFASVFIFGVGKAFVEGVSVFIVLNFFFISENWQETFWGETLSSYLVKALLFHQLSWYDYAFLAALLMGLHWVICYLRKSLTAFDNEELML